MHRFRALQPCLILLSLLFLSTAARGQEAPPKSDTEEEEPETLWKGSGKSGWVFSFDFKLSSLDGEFQPFGGFHFGWIAHQKLLIGLAGYGSTDDTIGLDMGYGGLQLEYFVNPNRLFNYSFRVLIGGGSADSYRARNRHQHGDTVFFAFEPEARVTLNIARRFRFGLGVGYRFADQNDSGLDLSAPVASFSFKIGSF